MACAGFKLPVPDQLRVRTPFGPVTGVPTGATPSPLDNVRGITGQLAALMAPLQGLFEIAEIALLIVDVVKSIPAAIGSLSPGKITQPLGKLAGKVPVLTNLLPQLSGARLVKDGVELVAANLEAIRSELQEIAFLDSDRDAVTALTDELREAGETAAADALDVTGACLADIRTGRVAALSAGNAGPDALVSILNQILALVPGDIPQIPTLGAIPDDVDAALALVDGALELLEPVRVALGPI